MGVDVRVTLAPGARLSDVADVAGIAAGLPWHSVHLPSGNGWYVRVDGASVKGYVEIPTMAEINLAGPMVDGQVAHSASYHFEWDQGEVPGCTGLMSRANPLWIAVGRRLVDFFGGAIDYQDCDGVDVDYAAPVAHRAAEDGEAWQLHQIAMASVLPITPDELVEAYELAAYRIDGRWK